MRFKSYLMSLGIDDPVTRDAFRSDSEYYMGLSHQIADMIVAALVVSISYAYNYISITLAFLVNNLTLASVISL